MQRASRTNLILLGIAVLLGVAVYSRITTESAGFEPPLSNLDPDQVQRVAANCHGCTARSFERRDGHWWMTSPYSLPADDAMVERLIGIAASPVRSRRPLQELDAGKIGLDPSLMHLALDDRQFDIGMTDAMLGDRYVLSGKTVAMVPDRFSPFLTAAAESELDRHLVPRGSVLASLRINDVDRPDLIETWTGALAGRISASDGTAVSDAGDIVELLFGDGAKISYHIIRNGDVMAARRIEPPLSYTLSPGQAIGLLGDINASAD